VTDTNYSQQQSECAESARLYLDGQLLETSAVATWRARERTRPPRSLWSVPGKASRKIIFTVNGRDEGLHDAFVEARTITYKIVDGERTCEGQCHVTHMSKSGTTEEALLEGEPAEWTKAGGITGKLDERASLTLSGSREDMAKLRDAVWHCIEHKLRILDVGPVLGARVLTLHRMTSDDWPQAQAEGTFWICAREAGLRVLRGALDDVVRAVDRGVEHPKWQWVLPQGQEINGCGVLRIDVRAEKQDQVQPAQHQVWRAKIGTATVMSTPGEQVIFDRPGWVFSKADVVKHWECIGVALEDGRHVLVDETWEYAIRARPGEREGVSSAVLGEVTSDECFTIGTSGRLSFESVRAEPDRWRKVEPNTLVVRDGSGKTRPASYTPGQVVETSDGQLRCVASGSSQDRPAFWEERGNVEVCPACGTVREGTAGAGLAHMERCTAYRQYVASRKTAAKHIAAELVEKPRTMLADPDGSLRLDAPAPSAAFDFRTLSTELEPEGMLVAQLRSVAGVMHVAWQVVATDETTTPAQFNQIMAHSRGEPALARINAFRVGKAGTAGLLRCIVNHGLNDRGEVDPRLTFVAKWWVPTEQGLEVFTSMVFTSCEQEHLANVRHPTTGEHANWAARAFQMPDPSAPIEFAGPTVHGIEQTAAKALGVPVLCVRRGHGEVALYVSGGVEIMAKCFRLTRSLMDHMPAVSFVVAASQMPAFCALLAAAAEALWWQTVVDMGAVLVAILQSELWVTREVEHLLAEDAAEHPFPAWLIEVRRRTILAMLEGAPPFPPRDMLTVDHVAECLDGLHEHEARRGSGRWMSREAVLWYADADGIPPLVQTYEDMRSEARGDTLTGAEYAILGRYDERMKRRKALRALSGEQSLAEAFGKVEYVWVETNEDTDSVNGGDMVLSAGDPQRDTFQRFDTDTACSAVVGALLIARGLHGGNR